MTNQFEETIWELTKPFNDQYPRPWMTKMKNPWEAEVFIVGKNQKKGYSVSEVSHQRHLDALFNRNGECCRGLYDKLNGGTPSPTRKNSDGLVARLNNQNMHNILETNVICYSTPMSRGLSNPVHSGGAKKGEEIFRYLLAEIAPSVIIVHGADSVKRISSILKLKQLRVPGSPDEICDVQTDKHLIIPIPSLAPPAFNKWSRWSNVCLDEVANRTHEKLVST